MPYFFLMVLALLLLWWFPQIVTSLPSRISTRISVFKNVTIYRIAPGWSATVADMEAALDAARFKPGGATQDKSVGWVEPRGEAHGPLVESVAGQRILKLQIETKGVPGSVVKKKAQEEADHIEATTGRKPGKKETKALREDAFLCAPDERVGLDRSGQR
eukprot:gene16029-33700_t